VASSLLLLPPYLALDLPPPLGAAAAPTDASRELHLAHPPVHRPAPPPRFDFATVARDSVDLLRDELSSEQQKHLAHLLACRTQELGGHLQHCQRCGHCSPAYNSCRDRHCTKCQALDQLRWYEARVARGLPVPYFHVVLTLPAKLRPIFRANKAVLYAVFMRTASRVALDLASEQLHGAQSALISVLHTWNARYRYHPHVHLIVAGGGLTKDGEWVPAPSDRSLLPTDLLRARFRAALLVAIAAELEKGSIFAAKSLPSLLQDLARPEVYWHGYAKRTLKGAEDAIRYLASYACRPGFSDGRILSYDPATKVVVYATKHGEHVTTTGLELLRLHLEHHLPHGFMRIRYYGFLSGCVATKKLALARASLARQGVVVPPPAPPPSASETFLETWKRRRGVDLSLCPRCDAPMERIPFSGAAHEHRLRAELAALRRRRLGRARDP
jgi:hypothetical protein